MPEAIDGAPVVPSRLAWAITEHMRWLGARMAELDRDLDATIRSPLWRANCLRGLSSLGPHPEVST